MSPKINILLTGATGYIGGSILARILKHPEISNFDITVLVRSREKAYKLSKFGVRVAVGSHSDPEVVTPLAANNDIVIATTAAADMGAAKAVLAGLKKRFEETGIPPALVETSGTGAFSDDSGGDLPSNTILWNDMNADQIEAVKPQLHRDVDLEIVRADQEGYIKSYIVLPGVVLGSPTGALVDQGIQNPIPMVIALLAQPSRLRGAPCTVGRGLNVFPVVSLSDTTDLFVLLFDAIRKTPTEIGHGREGYYFAENGEASGVDLGRAIGETMVALGKATDSEPTPLTDEELVKYFGGSKILGSTTRCVGNRSRSLGWAPKVGKAEMLASIAPVVEALLQ